MGMFWVFDMKGGVRKPLNNKNTSTSVCSRCSAVEGEVVEATKLEGMHRRGEDDDEHEKSAPVGTF